MIKKALLVFMAGVLLHGCGTLERLDSSPMAAALTIQYATLKYIGDDAEKAQRVYNQAGALDVSGTATLALLEMALRDSINWQALDAADRLLLNTLLTELHQELELRYGRETLDREDRVRLVRVITWVQDAALVAGAKE